MTAVLVFFRVVSIELRRCSAVLPRSLQRAQLRGTGSTNRPAPRRRQVEARCESPEPHLSRPRAPGADGLWLERAQQGLEKCPGDRHDEQRQRYEQRGPQRACRGQEGKRADDEVPLGQERHELGHAPFGVVDRLEGAASPRAVVDAPAPARRLPGEAVSVQTTAPRDVSSGGVLLGPLALEVRLGGAVATLLAPVGADGVAPVVPDDRSRAEADGQPAFAQPPADVYVVSGRAEALVEAANLLERLSAKGHVAAGN